VWATGVAAAVAEDNLRRLVTCEVEPWPGDDDGSLDELSRRLNAHARDQRFLKKLSADLASHTYRTMQRDGVETYPIRYVDAACEAMIKVELERYLHERLLGDTCAARRQVWFTSQRPAPGVLVFIVARDRNGNPCAYRSA